MQSINSILNNSTGEITVSPGIHHYTFECFLPAELPTSMEGNHGHIRYNACVVMDIPMWPDKEFDCPFTVVKLIDLNLNPVLRVRFNLIF